MLSLAPAVPVAVATLLPSSMTVKETAAPSSRPAAAEEENTVTLTALRDERRSRGQY